MSFDVFYTQALLLHIFAVDCLLPKSPCVQKAIANSTDSKCVFLLDAFQSSVLLVQSLFLNLQGKKNKLWPFAFVLSTLSLPYAAAAAVAEALFTCSAPFRRARNTEGLLYEGIMFSMWECKCKVCPCFFVNSIFWPQIQVSFLFFFYVMDSAYTTCAMWSQYYITIHYDKKVIYMVLLCPLFWPCYRLIIIYWRKREQH